MTVLLGDVLPATTSPCGDWSVQAVPTTARERRAVRKKAKKTGRQTIRLDWPWNISLLPYSTGIKRNTPIETYIDARKRNVHTAIPKRTKSTANA